MLIAHQYNCGYQKVNNHSSLTPQHLAYSFSSMKYGERLKAAREHARLTQGELAERIDQACSQPNISKLERSNATGSEFTAQFAEACGVNPYWLATGKGEMVVAYRPKDKRMEHAMKIMESLPPEALDYVIQDIDKTAELIEKMKHHEPKKRAG